MKLPWQHPPGLVEGCSSVSVGWLADMLADGPSWLLGKGRIGPPSTFLVTCPPGSVLVILSLFSRLHRALECPTWTIDLSWSNPLMEQVGKLRRKVSAPGIKGRQDLMPRSPDFWMRVHSRSSPTWDPRSFAGSAEAYGLSI